ncbi:unnamed protein product [Toxocara canis]|uniref:Na_H_Exchanger domain-containing protein n=1 Tax=Toxocara canis TaxID=6265 RepID=A0A183TXB0_TOXCA|nr:unnamed protein product [Toxocara canis]
MGSRPYKCSPKLISTAARFGACIAKATRAREVNLITCSIAIFASVYITAISVLHRPLVRPLLNENATDSNVDTADRAQSIVSVVLIWIAAVVVGRIASYVRLPNLLGVLLCGVALRNIPYTARLLFIDAELNNFLRKTALTIILIRGGIGLDFNALKKRKGIIVRFGVLSSVIEAAVIALVAHLIFQMDVIMCFIFGMTLAATSPAVTIPTMLGLIKKGYGNDSGVPTAILASAALDNMICIMLFNVFLSLITANESASLKIGLLVLQIIVGTIVGFVIGFLLWCFPRQQSRQLHFTRVSLLFWICMAFIFGAQAIGWDSGGVIATILSSFICSTEKESEAFALMWNLVGMQVMFATIGFEFDFSVLHLNIVLKGFGMLVIAVIVRIIFVFLMSFGANFTKREQLFVSVAFLPKATVQAALVPQVMSACAGTVYEHFARIIMTTSVFAIIITAPIGQFVLQLLGPRTLKPRSVIVDVNALGTALSVDCDGDRKSNTHL